MRFFFLLLLAYWSNNGRQALMRPLHAHTYAKVVSLSPACARAALAPVNGAPDWPKPEIVTSWVVGGAWHKTLRPGARGVGVNHLFKQSRRDIAAHTKWCLTYDLAIRAPSRSLPCLSFKSVHSWEIIDREWSSQVSAFSIYFILQFPMYVYASEKGFEMRLESRNYFTILPGSICVCGIWGSPHNMECTTYIWNSFHLLQSSRIF